MSIRKRTPAECWLSIDQYVWVFSRVYVNAVSFDILDFDRDNKLSRQELLSMLEACIQENAINIPKDCLDTIVAKTMEDVDADKDGFISYDEYRALGDNNPQMLNHVTFNISGIIAEYMPTLRAVLATRIAPS